MDKRVLWEQCAAFHGHVCPGLTIGYRAALYAIDLLELTFSKDEQVVCISENDACGCDAIQVILGCTIGKGNLLFHITGKQAFSFYRRDTGRSVRLVLRALPEEMTREQVFEYYQTCRDEAMFAVKEAKIALPERARRFSSHPCARCGESTGENWLHPVEGQLVCCDCYEVYDRFRV